MLSRFHRTPERDGRTDGQTDRIAISVLRVSILTRDKKCRVASLVYRTVPNKNKKFSCRRDRAMLRVIEYFAKSLEVTEGHSI